MTSIWAILNAEELAAMSAVTGVFGALCILIASLAVLPSSKLGKYRGYDASSLNSAPAPLHSQHNAGALPPQQEQPADVYAAPHGAWRAPDTGDLVQRGSVVEGTTKLLKRDE